MLNGFYFVLHVKRELLPVLVINKPFPISGYFGRERVVINSDLLLAVHQVGQVNWIYSKERDAFHTNMKLGQVEKNLDPRQFFKVNRQQIINRDTIISYEPQAFGKLSLKTNIQLEAPMIVSKGRASEFMKWLAMI